MKRLAEMHLCFRSVMYLSLTGFLCAQVTWPAESQSVLEEANSTEHVTAINRTRHIVKQIDRIHADTGTAGILCDHAYVTGGRIGICLRYFPPTTVRFTAFRTRPNGTILGALIDMPEIGNVNQP